MVLRLALVGFGAIARNRHLPAIAATSAVELVGVASHSETPFGVPGFPSLRELLASGLAVDTVALCTPPQGRAALAAEALAAGKHVLLEKPPGVTLFEWPPLVDLARHKGLSLFGTWHSRFAPAVEATRATLRDAPPKAVRVVWKEDVHHWHPGQAWIWKPGGMGVFDPGINALSILTRILPAPIALRAAELSYPANREAPIAARLSFVDLAGMAVEAEFDWRQAGRQSWDIHLDTADGSLLLEEGGRRLLRDGAVLAEGPMPSTRESTRVLSSSLRRSGQVRPRSCPDDACGGRLHARAPAHRRTLRRGLRDAVRADRGEGDLERARRAG